MTEIEACHVEQSTEQASMDIYKTTILVLPVPHMSCIFLL